MSPRRAVFFDFAGTLFSDRACATCTSRSCVSSATRSACTASDDELRAAYRAGMGGRVPGGGDAAVLPPP